MTGWLKLQELTMTENRPIAGVDNAGVETVENDRTGNMAETAWIDNDGEIFCELATLCVM